VDFVGYFREMIFLLNPIMFKLFPCKDCFPGLLGEVIFPTFFSTSCYPIWFMSC
jgi:hypothetical protein